MSPEQNRVHGSTRRRFLHRAGLAIAAGVLSPPTRFSGAKAFAASAPGDLSGASTLEFLRGIASATIESARIRPGQSRSGYGPNTTGITLISPGGNYPALWTRDFAMSLDCGLISAEEILPQFRLLARCQNGDKERHLPSGGIIPPFSIVDHVNLSGGAVFYPGTYSSGDDQGCPPWGPLPPADDHFYFVHIAHVLWKMLGQTGFLEEKIEGMSLFDRVERAFASPESDAKTGAIIATKERRAVGFGFQDSVYLQGAMSFATLLRYRAAKQLSELCRAKDRPRSAAKYEVIARCIVANIERVFLLPAAQDGWLRAATEIGRQPDVWATLFALHLGVLSRKSATRARKTIAAAVRAPGNTVEYQGAIRHVPSDRYFKPGQCWESGGTGVNTYQSGAFWHTPTGWLVEALQRVDSELAREVSDRFIEHLKGGDFRKGGAQGAPWECFGIKMAGAQNPVYMTSVTLPLAVLQGMIPKSGQRPDRTGGKK